MPARSRSWARRALVLLAVLGLAATACGGGGSKTNASSTGKSTTSTTAQDVAADKAAAQRAILRLSDLPTGWEQKPHETSADSPDVNSELAACLNVDPKLLSTPDNPTSVDAPDFSHPEGASVSNNVSFTESIDKARQAMATFAKVELPKCLGTVLTNQITAQAPSGLTFGTIDAKRLSMKSGADETSAIRVVIPIEAEGFSVNQYLDMVVFRVGRAGATITFSNSNTAVDPAFEERLVGVVVQRLQSPSATTTTAK